MSFRRKEESQSITTLMRTETPHIRSGVTRVFLFSPLSSAFPLLGRGDVLFSLSYNRIIFFPPLM